MSTSRPVRERKQPLRNKDKVELDLKLIEQLETSKNAKTKANSEKSEGKLLVAFINAINQSYRQNQDEPKQTNLRTDQNYGPSKKMCDQYPQQFTKSQKIKNNSYNRIQNKVDKLPEPKYSGFNQRPRTPSNYVSGKQTKSKKTVPLQTQGGQSNNFNSVKTFKRHAYHIAIAYRIHLQRLKDKEIPNNRTQMLDPTYPAKKLKRDQCGSDK